MLSSIPLQEVGGVRKIDSETDPAPKSKNPDPAQKLVSLQIFDSES